MKLKHQYLLSLVSLVISGWGGGMVFVGWMIGNTNPINTPNAIGLILVGLGLAIMIKTLSTIRKVDFEIDES